MGISLARIVKLCLAMLFVVLKSVHTALFRLVGRPIPSTFVVLMYHSVKQVERERFARQMEQLVQLANPVRADFVPEKTGQERTYVAVTFDDGYESILENAIPILLEKRIPATVFVPTKYLGFRPAWITQENSRDIGEKLLSVDDLPSLRKLGVLIGSHSMTHRPLTELSPAEAFTELSESRQVLERILGEEVSLFALPYGASNADILRLSREAGYDRVFLGDPLYTSDNVEGHVAGRIGASPGDWPLEYRLKILGAYQWLPLAIAAKKRMVNFLHKFSTYRSSRGQRVENVQG
jgi:peptidoglycan/xylan/chitin deacetylase (PgdA/CDA1 family)